jgi:hypothetical protein
MAKVLAAVPTHGLDAVLAVVEQMLASGVANAEHVLNVLARLNQAPCPERVETGLSLAKNRWRIPCAMIACMNMVIPHAWPYRSTQGT